MSNIYSINLQANEEDKLFETFKDTAVTPPKYAKWQLRPENCVITCYESGKTVFQGKDASIYASAFIQQEDEIFPQAGSDEVGTGDYFGPVCVCAAYVDKTNEEFLLNLKVKDSKAISDQTILDIAPKIMKQIPYTILILDNPKYNAVHKSNNLNEIKSKLHNQAYINLSKKITLPALKVIDQFTPEKSYYAYLRNEKIVIRDISFYTKAENKYISVACASIIARYAFLQEFEKMEKKYTMQFKKGSGKEVDICAKEFVEKYGFDALEDVAKIHFKNTERIE